jgi:hypothetical protein
MCPPPSVRQGMESLCSACDGKTRMEHYIRAQRWKRKLGLSFMPIMPLFLTQEIILQPSVVVLLCSLLALRGLVWSRPCSVRGKLMQSTGTKGSSRPKDTGIDS